MLNSVEPLNQLKKVINRVANELKDLGLTSEVLKELLQQPGATSAGAAAGPSSPPEPPASAVPASGGTLRWADQEPAGSGSDDEKNAGSEARIEEVLDEVEGVVEAEEEEPRMSEKAKGKQKAVRKRRVRASYELGGAFLCPCLSRSMNAHGGELTRSPLLTGTTANPEPRIHLVFSSCSSESYSESDDGRSHRAASDLDDDDVLDGTSASPANFLFKRHARKRSAGSRKSVKSPKSQVLELASSEGDDDDAGDDDQDDSAPASLAVEAGSSSGPSTDDPSSIPPTEDATEVTESSGSVAEEIDSGDGVEFEGAGPQANELLKRMYGVGRRWSEDDGEGDASIVELDPDADEASAVPATDPPAQDTPRVLHRALSQETLRASGTPLRSELLESLKTLELKAEGRAQEKAERRGEQADQADDEGDAPSPRAAP